jgi:hypothetical protein
LLFTATRWVSGWQKWSRNIVHGRDLCPSWFLILFSKMGTVRMHCRCY